MKAFFEKNRITTVIMAVLLAVLTVVVAKRGAVGKKEEPVPESITENIEVVENRKPETDNNESKYINDPENNPYAMKDIVPDKKAVYGFRPDPKSEKLKEFSKEDWSDIKTIEKYREKENEYYARLKEIYVVYKKFSMENYPAEDTVKAIVSKINEREFLKCNEDEDNIEELKKINRERYGNEKGQTAESYLEKYGTWDEALKSLLCVNSALDACCGLYDDYYYTYVCAGEIEEDNNGYVKANNVCIRLEPSQDAVLLGVLNYGNEIIIAEKGSEWSSVISGDNIGYIYNEYIDMLGDKPKAKSGDIVEFAKKLEGAKYKWGGDSPEEGGFDCSGLVFYVYGNFGMNINRMASDQALNGMPVEIGDIRPGDIICFKNGNYISHSGIYIGDGLMIHSANERTGVITSEVLTFEPGADLVIRRLSTD